MMPASQRRYANGSTPPAPPFPKACCMRHFPYRSATAAGAGGNGHALQWNYHELTDYARRCAGRLIDAGFSPAIMWLSRCRKAQDNCCGSGRPAGRGGLRSGFAGSPAARREKIYADASVRLVLICSTTPAPGQTIFPPLPGSRP